MSGLPRASPLPPASLREGCSVLLVARMFLSPPGRGWPETVPRFRQHWDSLVSFPDSWGSHSDWPCLSTVSASSNQLWPRGWGHRCGAQTLLPNCVGIIESLKMHCIVFFSDSSISASLLLCLGLLLWLSWSQNPPAMWETWVRSLAWEDPLEKGKATHSSILAWRIPYSPWGRKKSDVTE